ncbi:hypothetical protein KDI_30060 [Dictyobacter arantiisoli]|uniref:Uncharacterized protein n=1 Tax=Dictyobacter arantiisoli TaxID=2014874 RepID=A0A5A5TDA3_9CHLR|nr:hypothetical protein KDI_30060 [Dictyobacter arantiisoli]
MATLPVLSSKRDPKRTRAIQCTNCQKTSIVGLADGGKDIHFLNMVTWECPTCHKNNVTPFLENIAS